MFVWKDLSRWYWSRGKVQHHEHPRAWVVIHTDPRWFLDLVSIRPFPKSWDQF